MRRKIFKFAGQLAIVGLLCFGLYASYLFYQQNQTKRREALQQAANLPKSFVIIIPAYNNTESCEKNLFSVLTQQYENFRVIYIDDHSEDDSYTKAERLISILDSQHRVTLVRNSYKKGTLASLSEAIDSCKNSEIVLIVEGSDFLSHEHVLTKLSRIYASPFVWMTYGNFLDYPSYRQIPVKCKPFPKSVVFNNSFRSHEEISTHLKTFYASLFKEIRKEDLFYNGRFFSQAWELAVMFPLLEMSGKHAHFVNDVLYLHNRSHPSAEAKAHPELYSDSLAYLKKLPKYKRIKALNLEEMPNQENQ